MSHAYGKINTTLLAIRITYLTTLLNIRTTLVIIPCIPHLTSQVSI